MNSKIRRIGYLRVLFYGIPMGVIFIISGIYSLFSPPTDHFDMKNKTSRNFTIEIKDYVKNKPRYLVTVNKTTYKPVDRESNNKVTYFLEKNDLDNTTIARVYYYGNNYIGHLEIDDIVVINYKKNYFSFHFFFWIGLVLVVTGVLYIVKYPHDLYGGENKEEGLKKHEEFIKKLYDKMS